jgi:protein phosphatase
MGFRLRSAGVTDVGRKRDHNEDTFAIDAEHELYVLADGMGGHASGEVASKLAVDELVEFYTSTCRTPGFSWPYDTAGLETFEEKALVCGILHANDRVFIESMKDRRYDGMGTTLCVAAKAGDRLVLAHVGDSRIYRLRDGEITQITEDHSLLNHLKRTRGMTAEEAKSFTSNNVIVRAIGLKEYVEVDTQTVDLAPDDIFLLCSDGLSDLVDDWILREVVEANDGDIDEAAKTLVRIANQNGGKDNITVVLIAAEGAPDAASAASRPAGEPAPEVRTVTSSRHTTRNPVQRAAAEDEIWQEPTRQTAIRRDTRPDVGPATRIGGSRIGIQVESGEVELPDVEVGRDTVRISSEFEQELLREGRSLARKIQESDADARPDGPPRAAMPRRPEGDDLFMRATAPTDIGLPPIPPGPPPPPTSLREAAPAAEAKPRSKTPPPEEATVPMPAVSAREAAIVLEEPWEHITHPELQRIFRTARVAPLPPIPPGED